MLARRMSERVMRYEAGNTPAAQGAAAVDSRPVRAVVEAAAESIGLQDAAAPILQALVDHGILWAWQLAELSEANWAKLAVPMGLQAAVRADLFAPMAAERALLLADEKIPAQ